MKLLSLFHFVSVVGIIISQFLPVFAIDANGREMHRKYAQLIREKKFDEAGELRSKMDELVRVYLDRVFIFYIIVV